MGGLMGRLVVKLARSLLLIGVVGVLASLALFTAAQRDLAGKEHRLLVTRSRVQISTILYRTGQLVIPLREASVVATTGTPEEFTRLVKRVRIGSISVDLTLLGARGKRWVDLAHARGGTRPRLTFGPNNRSRLTSAAAKQQPSIINTDRRAGRQHVLVALPGLGRKDRLVYADIQNVGPHGGTGSELFPRIDGLDFALYPGTSPNPLLSATSVASGQLTGYTFSQRASISGFDVFIVTKARGPLTALGDQAVPWVALGAGLVLTLMLMLVTRNRRRQRATASELTTEVQQAQDELLASERRFTGLFDNASDIVMLLDAEGCIVEVNQAGTAALGRTHDQLLGMRLVDLSSPDNAATLDHFLERTVATGTDRGARHASDFISTSGRRIPLDMSVAPMRSGSTITGMQVMARDVTDQREFERQLTHQAHHDALTGLANRALMFDEIDRALTGGHSGRRTVVLMIDLDEFKQINDNFGHAAGDELLREVARRIATTMRPEDVCARLGGDEFAVVIEHLPTGIEPGEVAERLLEVLRRPIMLAGQAHTIGASVGIAEPTDERIRANELLRNADIAMYEAKNNGRNCFAIFDESMLAEITARARLIDELEQGIERGELVAHFQPIVLMETGRITAAEALVRWQHPTRGLLGPTDFIPLAEETGLIVQVGRWMMREACRQATLWAKVDDEIAVTVNVSGRELEEHDFFESVRTAIAASGIDASRLIVEITETLLLGDSNAAEQLLRLKALGVQIAVDDFGKGYSSLDYLRRFPIDVLKIDKGFTERLDDERGASLFAAIIQLAHSIGLETVAEGIETMEQFSYARHVRCDRGQGFLFDRPLEAEMLVQRLLDFHERASAQAA